MLIKKIYPKRMFSSQTDPFDALWDDIRRGEIALGVTVKVWDQELGGWITGIAGWWIGQPCLNPRKKSKSPPEAPSLP